MIPKKLKSDPENRLIQEAINGQEEAFIQLYRQYVSKLYFFVFNKVNSQTDAEDITSETFYQALKDLKKYSHKSSFKNWLYGIAKHLIMAFYRQKYNKTPLELNENIATINAESNNQIDPLLERKTQKLTTVLQSLPKNYRTVLDLRFLKGYSILETAKTLGISEENAKVLQHRALKKANQLALEGPQNP